MLHSSWVWTCRCFSWSIMQSFISIYFTISQHCWEAFKAAWTTSKGQQQRTTSFCREGVDGKRGQHETHEHRWHFLSTALDFRAIREPRKLQSCHTAKANSDLSICTRFSKLHTWLHKRQQLPRPHTNEKKLVWDKARGKQQNQQSDWEGARCFGAESCSGGCHWEAQGAGCLILCNGDAC